MVRLVDDEINLNVKFFVPVLYHDYCITNIGIIHRCFMFKTKVLPNFFPEYLFI